MFKIYDLNMKEIPFPDGVMPLEIFVGSVGKERTVDTVDGRPGIVDYGFNYTGRPVSLFLRIKATDKIDFRLLRNEVFAIFDIGNAFYVAESDVPSRVLKVVVDESYIPDRLTEEYADFDINCRTLDSVFWESKYTTLELHDSGYSAIAEKYGLVDNIDDEKVKYRFEPDFETVDLRANLFEHGSIILSNGQNNDENQKFVRSKNMHSVNEGDLYRLSAVETSGTVRYIRVFHYDSSGAKVGESVLTDLLGNGSNAVEFTAEGSSIRLLLYPEGDATVNINGIGTLTKITLSTPSNTSTFTVYNAGNVTVEPESAQLYIQLNYVTSNGNLKVTNKTTGESFEYHQPTDRRHIVLDGMVMTVGGVNRFRDSNRRFISLAPGDNEFEITGATFNEIRFNFKYYYK